MARGQDFYERLGIGRSATQEEIRKSYRRLARKFHPDLNPGDKSAEDAFKKIQEAYDVLSDARKRKVYDQFGTYSEAAFPGGAGGPQGPGMDFGGFDFTDFFTQASGGRPRSETRSSGSTSFGDSFGDIFGQFFGRGAQREAAAQPEKGADLEYALRVDFWQSIRGTQVRLKISRQEACSQCGGSGSGSGRSTACASCGGSGTVTQTAGAMRFNLTCPRCQGRGKLRSTCAACHGDGRIVGSDLVEVRIPPGVQSGSRLRVAGKGNAGTMGAPAGDLYITVQVEEHPFFKRDGDDIHIQVPVTVWEAALGAKIEVPTIDGRALLKIPQGTRNGQKFRLREKGVLNSRKDRRGDQIVEALVQAPAAQDERTREILRELAQLHPEDPRSEIWEQV